MSSHGVRVILKPRTVPCHAVSTWHSESALFACSFEYSATPRRAPATAADRIDAAVGISATPTRALLGDVDVAWKDESRLHSIELRTSQIQWQRSHLPVPSGHAEKNSMSFELEYDVNHIASIDLDARVLWDAQQAKIGLRFGNSGPDSGRWVVIADSVFVCVDDEQTLIEIRFADVRLSSNGAS